MATEIPVEQFMGGGSSAASSSTPQEIPVEDFMAPEAGAGRGHINPKKLTATEILQQDAQRFERGSRALSSNAASVADMAVNIPSQAAGSIGELTLQRASAELGLSRAAGEEAASDYRDYITSKTAVYPFTKLVQKIYQNEAGGADDKNAVEKVMSRLDEMMKRGAKIVSEKTGNALTEKEVLSEMNFAMSMTGARALSAAKMPKGKAEEAPPQPSTSREVVPYRPITRPADDPSMSRELVPQKDVKSDSEVVASHRQYVRQLDKLTDQKVSDAKIKRESGQVDLKLLGALAAGSTGLALAMKYPSNLDDVALGGLALVGTIGPPIGKLTGELAHAPLGSLLNRGEHSLRILEELNQNHTEFPIDRIQQELRRPEVTKAERDIVREAIKGYDPKGKITAAELVREVKKATGDFVLSPKQTDSYASYGLEAIDRLEANEGLGGEEHPQARIERLQGVLADPIWAERAAAPPKQRFEDFPYTADQARAHLEQLQAEHADAQEELNNNAEGPNPKTTIWQADFPTDPHNHFDEPNYFAHSREFQEGGVTHVVELQSDFVQKNRPLSPEQMARGKELSKEFAALVEEDARIRREEGAEKAKLRMQHYSARTRNTPEFWNAFDDIEIKYAKKTEGIQTRRSEINEELAKLRYGPNTAKIADYYPMFKNWHRRIIREILARDARDGRAVTRFATADTVAKVEGWPEVSPAAIESLRADYARTQRFMETEPEDPFWPAQAKQQEAALARLESGAKFNPEHQGIYNRYKGDVEPFLRSLGGKRVEDSAGHSWYELPTGVKEGKSASARPLRAQMFGGTTPDALLTLAAVTLGAYVGGKLDPDNPLLGAVLGATLGFPVTKGIVDSAHWAFKSLAKADDRIRINNLAEKHDLGIKRVARAVYQLQEKLYELVPDEARRVAINAAIDTGKVAGLKGKEAEAAKLVQEFYSMMGKTAKDLGILDEMRENYTTHLWAKKDKPAIEEFLRKKPGPSMSPQSPFAKQRSFDTIAEGKAAGFKPKTEDVAQVAGIYGNAMGRTIANKRLLNDLQKTLTDAGVPLVEKTGKAPSGYVSMNHPALFGLRVHPDIVPSMRFMFDATEPTAFMAGLEMLNTAIKRNAVSYSLFHAKALTDAVLGAVNNPLTVGKVLGQAALPKIFGENRYLQMLKDGKVGDLVDDAMDGGVQFSFKRGEPGTEDVGSGFYRGLELLQQSMDSRFPFKQIPAHRPLIKAVVRVNHAFDNFMWARLHASMKLEVFAAKREALIENNARAGTSITKAEANRIAGEYTNDVFGGLNWQRLAESTESRIGREISLGIMSPRGRQGLQLLLFAPDWTLSTSRAFAKALPWVNKSGSGLKGLFDAKTSADLYRQQLARSALYYFFIGNALNQAFTGKWLWENKDPMMVDLGDGRKMQLSKHFMEPFHWMTDGRQQALNKLGVLPREAATQALGVEYLSAKGRMPPMKTDPITHVMKNAIPIAGNQFENDFSSGVAGFAGLPIYGKTDAQKAEDKAKVRDLKFQNMLKQYRKEHGLE